MEPDERRVSHMLVVRPDCDRCELAGDERCTGGRCDGPVPREAAARPEDRCATAGRSGTAGETGKS